MNRPNLRPVWVGLLVALCLSSAAYSGTIRDDRDAQLYLNLGASPLYASVGKVLGWSGTTPNPDYSNFNFMGSGVLIRSGNNEAWILTAAHVVQGATALTFTITNGLTDVKTYVADRWVANSKFNSFNLGAGNDIGLIHLSSLVTEVAPATLYTGSSELGKVGTSAGYGMTGTGLTGSIDDWDNIQKRAGTNMVDAFYTGTKNVILMDFDNPNNAKDSSYGSSDPLELEYLIAPGDSGGGLFAEIDGKNQLIGIHSFGWGRLDGNPDSDYGDVSGDTRVSRYIDWINEAITGGKAGGKGGGKSSSAGRTFIEGDYEFAFLDIAVVPEPVTLCLLSLGGLMLVSRRRR